MLSHTRAAARRIAHIHSRRLFLCAFFFSRASIYPCMITSCHGKTIYMNICIISGSPLLGSGRASVFRYGQSLSPLGLKQTHTLTTASRWSHVAGHLEVECGAVCSRRILAVGCFVNPEGGIHHLLVSLVPERRPQLLALYIYIHLLT